MVFANGDSACLTQEITKYSIDLTLKTWLLVQAYVMIGIAAVLLLAAIVACVAPTVGAVIAGFGFCLLILYSLFNIAWTIVGAVMFWGELDPAGTCKTGLTVYMWIILILGCLSILSCLCSGRGMGSGGNY